MRQFVNSNFLLGCCVFASFAISSCKVSKEESRESDNVEVEQISVEVDFDVKLSSFIREIVYLPIDSQANIGFVDKMLSFKNYIILGDFDQSQTISIMDEDFRLLASISNFGEGPGEYNYIADVTINEALQSIDLLSFRKVLRYDFSGKFIEEFTTPAVFTKFQSHGDGGYLVYQPSAMHVSLKGEDNGLLLSYWNPYTKSLTSFFPDIYGGQLPMISERRNLIKENDEYYFSMTLSDTLFMFDSKSILRKKFFIDFDGKNVPPKTFSDNESIMEIMNSREFKEKYIFHVANLMVDDNKLISGFQGIGRTHGFFIYDFISRDVISSFSAENDIDSGLAFFIPMLFKDNVIYSVHEYDYFLEHYRKNKYKFEGESNPFTQLLSEANRNPLFVGVKYILK